MTIKIKPLLYIFVVLLVIFSVIGFVLSKTVLPAKQQKVFDELTSSTVVIPDDINEEQEKIHFTVNEKTSLADAVQELENVVTDSTYTNYTFAVNSDNESEQLVEGWQFLQYYVYEIIGQKKFTELPNLAVTFSKKYPDINLAVSMSEQYVFITLYTDEHQLYRMLPLQTTNVRMWG